MSKLTVEIAPFTVSSSKGEGYSHDIDPKEWSAEYLIYAAVYGVGVMVQRSTASLTDKAGHTDAERTKARDATIAKIVAGEMGRTAGGLSREDAALRDALEAQGGFKFLRIPTGKKTDKGNDKTTAEPVADAFLRFVEQLCKAADKPVDAAAKAAVISKLQATTAYKQAMGDIDNAVGL
jgi:hypothetical protein